MTADPDPIRPALEQSRKYRWLCGSTLDRVADWARRRGGSDKDMIKRAKRKLHQMCGAYAHGFEPYGAYAVLHDLPADADAGRVRLACRQVLTRHASTAERSIDRLEELYEAVFAVTGPPASVLDVGCGLHPFAIPWMQLPAECTYEAWDIDRRFVDLIEKLLAVLGRRGQAVCADVLVGLPPRPVDVIFLMKLLPILDRQEPGCGGRLLDGLPGEFIVASYPTASLGGRGKGMRKTYAAAMAGLLDEAGLPAVEVKHPDELVFVVDKRGGAKG